MDIQGKAAIVTGAGTGVGRATALQLADRGCSVLVNYSRSQDAAEAVAAEVEKRGVKALAFKAVRRLVPDYQLWRGFAYEYEHGKLAIDVINGGPLLREWVDDAASTPQDLDALALPDEEAWLSERQAFLRY